MRKNFEKSVSNGFKLMNKDFSKHISLNRLKGGITNTIYLIEFKNNDKYIIREFGNNTNYFLDRNLEIKILDELKDYDITRKIFKKLDNGCIESYLEGKTLKLDDFKNTLIIKQLSQKLFELHSIKILSPNERNAMLWTKINIWYNECIKLYKDDKENLEIIKYIGEEIKKKKEKKIYSPIVFCHNDLTPANVIYGNNEIKFIDFEYASYNFRGFDIGNMFCEYAGYDCDWEKLPKEEERLKFYQFYLRTENNIELKKLETEVKFYLPISNLFWSLWGFIQNKYSNVEFNYLLYAKKRLIGYHKTSLL